MLSRRCRDPDHDAVWSRVKPDPDPDFLACRYLGTMGLNVDGPLARAV